MSEIKPLPNGIARSERSFTVRLFGGLEVFLSDVPLPPLRSRKGGWLLALLTLRAGREMKRETLAELLWPDSLPSDALTGLRQSLADLRKALGPEAIRLQIPAARTLRFETAGAIIDVLDFDRAMKRGDREGLRQAAALYRGPLLEGCAELWVLPERETRRESYLRAIETLAAQAQADGAAAEAVSLLRRGVQADPLREGLSRSLMQALADCGEYADATQVYTTLRNRLFEQHRASPQAETTALSQRLRKTGRRRALPAPPGSNSASASTPTDFFTAELETAGHVPLALTALIGRVEEGRLAQAGLQSSRLVSLVGTGGAGKTRLALHAANELKNLYRDGVWFVDLSALADAAGLAQTIAAALGLREERGRSWNETLTTALSARQILLVLDNCEHLAAACAEIARELLTHSPGLRLLTTSRQPLGLTGEIVVRLEGLSLPEPGQGLQAIRAADAARLFVERAQAVRSEFTLSEHNAAAVTEICRLLDGLPLAIELAAALIESLTVLAIADRLKARFDLLVSDDPTRAARHQTLQAVVDWSYTLLAPTEQNLLRRLSVFAGGWTLDAAETICADEKDREQDIEDRGNTEPIQNPKSKIQNSPSLKSWEIARTLGRLAAKSLVMTTPQSDSMRYRLLETVRQEVRRRLEAAGETAEMRRRHAIYHLRLAETAKALMTGSDQAAWLERLESEHDNFRAALLEAGASACDALRLTCALGRFWQMRGYFSEGRAQIKRALAQSDPDCPAANRADALGWASLFATYQGDPAGEELALAALAAWDEAGDAQGKLSALGCLGIAAMNRGDYFAARAAFAQSLAAAQEAQDTAGIASASGYLGLVTASEGETDAAEGYFQQSLTLRRESGDVWGIAASLNNLGLLACHREDWTRASVFLEESLALRRRLKDRRSLAITLNLLGAARGRQGDAAQARTLLSEGLRLCWQAGDRRNLAYALEAFSLLFLREAEPGRAALLQEAARRLREEIGSPLSPADRAASVRERAALRPAPSEARYESPSAGAEFITLEEAVALCLTKEPVCEPE